MMRLRSKSTQLVVLVFAIGDSEFGVSNLQTHVDYWNLRSKDSVDFFFVGYRTPLGIDGEPSPTKDQPSEFLPHAFVNAIETIEAASSWEFPGQASIIIGRAVIPTTEGYESSQAVIDFSSIVEFDLVKALKNEVIDSVPALFEAIIRVVRDRHGTKPEWLLSDRLGGRKLWDSFVEGVASKLPKGVQKMAAAMDCFRIKNLERPNFS